MNYCTYLTTYKGNKLPPFYIGYTLIKKVLEKNYHGTVTSVKYKQTWQKELKEHPELFKTVILTTHITKIEAKQKETYFQRYFQVHKNPMYINMSISGENYICENYTEEICKKMSVAQRKRKYPPRAKGFKQPQEVKDKISKTLTGKKHSEERIQKRAYSRKGKKNSKPMPRESVQCGIETMKLKRQLMTLEEKQSESFKCSGEKNNFYGKKHSPESRMKMSQTNRDYLIGSIWWTNGIVCQRSKSCPGQDWIKGRKIN